MQEKKEVDEILASVRASDKSPDSTEEERESQGEHEERIARKILDFKEAKKQELIEMAEDIEDTYLQQIEDIEASLDEVAYLKALEEIKKTYKDAQAKLNVAKNNVAQAIKAREEIQASMSHQKEDINKKDEEE